MLSKAFLEISNCCNLSCTFCHGTAREKRMMTFDEFETLAGKLQGKAQYLYFHVLGEPLLHPELPRMIRRAAELGFRPMITTNGTLLAERGGELAETPVFKVSISLHASEANGAFAGEAYLSGCFDFARRASEKGIITAFRLWNIGGADKGNASLLDALHSAFPGEWRKIRSGECMAEHVYLEWGKKFDWPDLQAEEIGSEFFCYGLRDQIGILADGTVVPCCLDAEGALALGNLFEQEADEILASPRARAIYDGFTQHRAVEPLCRRCGYAAVTKRYRS